jgi:hypothetical protein
VQQHLHMYGVELLPGPGITRQSFLAFGSSSGCCNNVGRFLEPHHWRA